MTQKLYPGWCIVFAIFTTGFFVYGCSVYSFTLLTVPIAQELGWNSSVMSTAIALFWVTAPISFMAAKIDTFLPFRVSFTCGLILTGISFLILANTENLFHLYAARVIAGLGNSLVSIAIPLAISAWFNQKFGLALSLVFCGYHLGGGLLALLTKSLLSHTDWRNTSYVLAMVTGIIVPITVYILYKWESAREVGYALDGHQHAIGNPKVEVRDNVADNLRTSAKPSLKRWAYLGICASTIAFYLPITGLLTHLPSIINSIETHPFALGANLVSIMGFGAFIGVLVSGPVADRFGPKIILLLLYILIIAGVSAFLGGQSFPLILISAAFLSGVAFGGGDVVWLAFLKRRYNGQQFSHAFGPWFFLLVSTWFLSPILFGIAHDYYGNYDIILSIAIFPLLIGFLILIQIIHNYSVNLEQDI